MKEDRKKWRELRQGAYLLRTNLTAEAAEELWSKYMQLTEAEASFRGAEERTVHQALVPPTGATRKSSLHGRVPRLRPIGHPDTSAEAPASGRARALGKWGVDNAQP
jgi:hypothetical protein